MKNSKPLPILLFFSKFELVRYIVINVSILLLCFIPLIVSIIFDLSDLFYGIGLLFFGLVFWGIFKVRFCPTAYLFCNKMEFEIYNKGVKYKIAVEDIKKVLIVLDKSYLNQPVIIQIEKETYSILFAFEKFFFRNPVNYLQLFLKEIDKSILVEIENAEFPQTLPINPQEIKYKILNINLNL